MRAQEGRRGAEQPGWNAAHWLLARRAWSCPHGVPRQQPVPYTAGPPTATLVMVHSQKTLRDATRRSLSVLAYSSALAASPGL